jgi:hypothetical protein
MPFHCLHLFKFVFISFFSIPCLRCYNFDFASVTTFDLDFASVLDLDFASVQLLIDFIDLIFGTRFCSSYAFSLLTSLFCAYQMLLVVFIEAMYLLRFLAMHSGLFTLALPSNLRLGTLGSTVGI